VGYDLVISNGTVIDGLGLRRYRADVGVRHGRIVALERIRDRALEVLDADGHVVTPRFIGGHTRIDAQVFWDPLGTSSCWHGIVVGGEVVGLLPRGRSPESVGLAGLDEAQYLDSYLRPG
jgi:N-acyl-D-aspartate/D-glutamate deacylase